MQEISPSLAARRAIVGAFCYYVLDDPIYSDAEWDRYCSQAASNWELLTADEQWSLGSPEEIRASGYHIRFSQRALAGALDAYELHHGSRPDWFPQRWRMDGKRKYLTAAGGISYGTSEKSIPDHMYIGRRTSKDPNVRRRSRPGERSNAKAGDEYWHDFHVSSNGSSTGSKQDLTLSCFQDSVTLSKLAKDCFSMAKALKNISATMTENGDLLLTISIVMGKSEELQEEDIAILFGAAEEVAGRLSGSSSTPEEEKKEPPKRRRRSAKAEEPEEEPEEEETEEKKEPPKRRRGRPRKNASTEEEEEKPRRRRRSPKAEEPEEEEEEEEEEPEEKPQRRRRRKAEEPEEEEEETEEEEEPPKRRRRRKAEEPSGPTYEDVTKAASSAASNLGPRIAAEIALEFSPETGRLEDIPQSKWQKFIDTVEFELGDE